MKKLLIPILFLAFTFKAFCQQTEEAAVKATINTLFDGMRKGDTTILKSTFAKGMLLQSISIKKDGSTAVVNEDVEAFAKSVGSPHQQVYDERITFNDIKIDGPLASVWAPYKFYVGTTFSHCGVDVFQLMKTAAGWKIIYIVDTRRKDNCVD